MTKARKTPWWKDWPLLAAERIARQVYWNSPALRRWVKRVRANRPPRPQVADREALKRHLKEIGVTEGALVMAHTAVTGLCLTSGPAPVLPRANVLATANQLVDDLLELVGPSGTLVMPTHAAYQNEETFVAPAANSPPIRYDPATTPCGVGLANEVFWRRKGSQRSLHPYNMVAARGPLAAELLRDNLNDSKPLPHGIHSAYYRFCQRNGLVVSVGVSLARSMTLIHVAEETRDQQWPIKDFFMERQYVVNVDGRDKTYVVREHRPEYAMFCICERKLMRDLVGEGILHEGTVGTVQVGWAHSAEVVAYILDRNRTSPYPYYWPWLMRKPSSAADRK